MGETDKKDLRELEGKGLHIAAPAGMEPDPAVNKPISDEIYTGQEYSRTSAKREEKQQSIGKDISILVMITLVAGMLLGVAYGITEKPIAQAQAAARATAQSSVMSSAESFEILYSTDPAEGEIIPDEIGEAIRSAGIETTSVTQIDIAYDSRKSPAGYVITAVNPEGYGGDVELMCGITPDDDGTMTIEGISFLSLSETAGMGMRAKDESFLKQFSGKKIQDGLPLVYSKNGAAEENEIDAISGCTITTSAVTEDVNGALIAARIIAQGEQEVPK